MKTILHSIGEIRSSRPLLINKPTIPIPLVLTSFLLVFCFMFAAKAQELPVQRTPVAKAVSEITPLKIGDKIPDELWEMYFPVVSTASENEQYLSLGDFKDKLIILDFWATWCAPCITSLHKLDTLQEQFKDDLIVIPTSYESESKVKPFLTKRAINLPSLIEEEELKKYFPHRIIPHQVWLKNGEVLAITEPGDSSEENITKALVGNDLNVNLKWENLDFDPNKPLFIEGNGAIGKELKYISSFSTYIEGIDNGAIDVKSKSIAITNHTALQLYQLALESSLPLFVSAYNRFIIEVSDSLKEKLVYPRTTSRGNQRNWKNENSFCYNLFMPTELDKNTMQKHMLEDLNRFFGVYYGIKGDLATRRVKCLVIREQKSNQLKNRVIKQKPKEWDKKESFKKFHQKLAYVNRKLPTPIINQLEEDIFISKTLDVDLTDLSAVQVALSEYGFTIMEDWVEVEMIVLSELN